MKGAPPPRFDPGGRITITLRSARLIDRTLWTKKSLRSGGPIFARNCFLRWSGATVGTRSAPRLATS